MIKSVEALERKRKKDLLLWEKLLDLPDWKFKQCGRWLTKHLSYAIKHLPDKEGLIFTVFRNSVAMLYMIKKSKLFKNKILYMLGSRPKSKWTTFLDKLNTSIVLQPNFLVIELLQILLLDLISREKVYLPFWKPVCKDLSERLLLPTVTDSADLDLISSSNWLPKQVEQLRSLTILTTKHLNKNLQKISYPLSMSSLVDKWASEAISPVKLKTLKIKIYPTLEQKKKLDEFIDTSRYVYNRTLEHINNGHKINFMDLRDLLVTDHTKKYYPEYKEYDESINQLKRLKVDASTETIKDINEQIKTINTQRRNAMKKFKYKKNDMIHSFEIKTPKNIRANAVKQCCDAHKAGFSNLKNGNIKHFHMNYKKKKDSIQTIELSPELISIKDNTIKICPGIFDNPILKIDKHNNKLKRKLKDLQIENNVDIQRKTSGSEVGYYIFICVKTNPVPTKNLVLNRVCGVDPGVRTLATVYSHSMSNHETNISEYKALNKKNVDLLAKYNKKIDSLKRNKSIPKLKKNKNRKNLSKPKRIRKKHINKLDKKKVDYTNRLHWEFINDIVSKNDIIYFGDIKSHGIVKNGYNHTLNRCFNDLKFHVLKQRLIYKASIQGKQVILVPEHYTTKTCSCCGLINETVGSKHVFNCSKCNLKTGRDMNASKNMMLKGLFL